MLDTVRRENCHSTNKMLFWWWIAVALFIMGVSNMSVAGQDGTLTCPSTWFSGAKIQLACTVNKQRINAVCSSTTQDSRFVKNGVPHCLIGPPLYSSCLAENDYSRPSDTSCWCQQNSTHYIFQYTFTADPALHNGTWTCSKGCFDSNGVTINMAITNCPNVKVQASACDVSADTCHKEGTDSCTLDKDTRSTAVCKCKSDYNGPSCGDRTFDGPTFGGTTGGLCILCLALIIVGVIVAVMFYLYTQRTITFQGQNPKPPSIQQRQAIKDAIVDYFPIKIPKAMQGSGSAATAGNVSSYTPSPKAQTKVATRYIFNVFDTPADDPHPTKVTIVGKYKNECKEVAVQIQDIINQHNPGAYPRKLNAGGRDNSHELGNRNKDNSKPN